MKILLVTLLGISLMLSADPTPEEIRTDINEKIFLIESMEIPKVEVVNQTISGVPVRIYGNGKKTVHFLHGGAWVAGNIDTHDNVCRYLHGKTRMRIISVGYTNAPEGKYPGPLEESYKVLEWVGDGTIILGDSAGGNMSAALCMMARDRKGPTIPLQILVNPATNLTSEKNYFFAKNYASDVQMKDSYASPLFAKSLVELPEAFILLGEIDPLRSEGEEYAERLKSAGVPVETYMQKESDHLAGNFARASQQAEPSLKAIVEKLLSIK